MSQILIYPTNDRTALAGIGGGLLQLGIPEPASTLGAELQQLYSVVVEPDTPWIFYRHHSDPGYIMSLVQSGYVLSAASLPPHSGGKIVQTNSASPNGGNRWVFTNLDNGRNTAVSSVGDASDSEISTFPYTILIADQSGTTPLVMDVPSADGSHGQGSPGKAIQLYPRTGGANQHWHLFPSNADTNADGAVSSLKIVPEENNPIYNGGSLLTISGKNFKPGMQVGLAYLGILPTRIYPGIPQTGTPGGHLFGIQTVRADGTFEGKEHVSQLLPYPGSKAMVTVVLEKVIPPITVHGVSVDREVITFVDVPALYFAELPLIDALT